MTLTSPALLRKSFLCAVGLVAAAASHGQTSSVVLAQAQPAAATPAPAAVDKTAAQIDAENSRRWSIYWGWNRSNYSNSTIHFKGSDHDFTLKDVKATDLQTNTGLSDIFKYYLNPAEITIPQTNLRVAYQLNSDTAIALNLDHMKYVVVQDQSVEMSGCYKNGAAPQVCNNGQQVIGDQWLNFEHTDGLNILSIELEKQKKVDWFGADRAKVFGLVGVGIVALLWVFTVRASFMLNFINFKRYFRAIVIAEFVSDHFATITINNNFNAIRPHQIDFLWLPCTFTNGVIPKSITG